MRITLYLIPEQINYISNRMKICLDVTELGGNIGSIFKIEKCSVLSLIDIEGLEWKLPYVLFQDTSKLFTEFLEN